MQRVERNTDRAAKRGHARPAGVVEQITRKMIASELGRSRARPEAIRFWSASGRENRKPMMNERGKSDPAVVATKLANKAERSVAEPVEPRAGTKGNANQQHTGRTQSRETVSQVLAAHMSNRKGKEYLIVDAGKLAGTGAHSYSAGDTTGGSEEAARFKRSA